MVALWNRADHYIFMLLFVLYGRFMLWFVLLLLSLWSPYGIGRPYIFSCCGLIMVALCNRADHYIFAL